MKLRSRIHFYSSFLFAVLLIAANVTIYWAFSRMSVNHELKQIEAETTQAADAMRQITDKSVVQELLRAYMPLHGMIALVSNDDRTPLVLTSSSESQLSQLPLVYSTRYNTELISVEGRYFGLVSIPFIASDGEVSNVQAVVSLEEVMELLRILRLVLVMVTVVAMVPALISSGVLSRVIMRPIKAMTNTMKEVASSGQFVKLKHESKSKDELFEMGENFNEMIGLLERNFAKQEQFVSNASHELKTPLTIIESYANLLKRRGQERPELIVESVDAIHSEAIRMKEMTEQLLLLAKPNRQWKITMVELDITALVQQETSKFRKAFGREIIVQVSAEGSLYADTDEDMVKQIFIILLDNARKYSEEPITVEVDTKEGSPYIRVKDRGIGIPKSELQHIFERFYRVDQARSREVDDDTGGSGLGLSLASEIAAAIGAKIEIDSVEGIGTTALLILPKKSALSQ